MAPNPAQLFMSSQGQHPRPDYSGYAQPNLRTVQDLRQLQAAAYDQGDNSEAHRQLMSWYQNHDESELVDGAAFNGAIPQSMEHQAIRLQQHQERSRQHFTSFPAEMQAYAINGVPIVDMDPNEARSYLAMQMADTPPHARGELQHLSRLLDEASTSSIGIEWQAPEEQLIYEAPHDETGDSYVNWRQGAQTRAQGLEAMRISKGDANAAALSGVSADGLSYSRADDQSNMFTSATSSDD